MQRGEVAWRHHPICSSMPILRPCRMPRGSLWPICCALRPPRKRPSMYVGGWGLCPTISSWFGWSGRCAWQWWKTRDHCGVSQLEKIRWYVRLARTLPATTRGGEPTDGGRQSIVFQERTPKIHWLALLFTHAAGIFSVHVQLDGIKEGILPASVQHPW